MPPPDDRDEINESWARLVVIGFVLGVVVGVVIKAAVAHWGAR